MAQTGWPMMVSAKLGGDGIKLRPQRLSDAAVPRGARSISSLSAAGHDVQMQVKHGLLARDSARQEQCLAFGAKESPLPARSGASRNTAASSSGVASVNSTACRFGITSVWPSRIGPTVRNAILKEFSARSDAVRSGHDLAKDTRSASRFLLKRWHSIGQLTRID